MNRESLPALGALAVACLFAAGILFRSWRRRRTRPPLVAAVVVLALGAVAVTLALLGAPYRLVVGSAFIAAMLTILVSARMERGTG
jgi:peptidoglycan/LPS O-acetylase OafA/YrhL